MPHAATKKHSFWIPGECASSYGRLTETIEADVVVVGGGITGLTTALSLLRAGLRVVLVEANRVGCGSTGHATAKLTAQHRLVYARLENQFDRETSSTYAAANQAGMEYIASLIDELQIDCDFRRNDAVTYTTQTDMVAELHEEVEAACRAGLPASFDDKTDLPFEVQGAVRVTNQAQLDPYRLCLGLASAILAEGGGIFEQSRVMDVKEDDPVVVKTEQGEVHAKHVVLATLIPFLDRGGFFARTYPSRSYAIAVDLNGSAPAGMCISAESPVRSIRPLADGKSMIVVGEDHKVGQDNDTTRRYAALEAWARQHFFVTGVTHRWSAQDFVSVDGLPFIGRIPLSSDRILVVTGLNKWGLAMGAAAALMLTDLVQDRDHLWESVFDAQRTNLLASAKTFVSENLNVAQHFVGDHLKAVVAKELEELKPGEGAIVSHDGGRLAAYRTEAGVVHAVSPICTHLGCCVQWNTAEKSWDCPCHGSRFNCQGQVLQGPALKPLEQKDVSRSD